MNDGATALLALWNDVAAAGAADYEDWHAREHVPERLTVPGILWARRYGRCGGNAMPHYLTLYGLRHAEVLDSEPYRKLLREPTPMSRVMRPALVNVSRWVCRLDVDHGSGAGSHLAVRTLALGVFPDAVTQAADGNRGALSRLLAHRTIDAAPLPWLTAGQDAGIDGEWLLGVGFDAASGHEEPFSDGAVYVRLPIG